MNKKKLLALVTALTLVAVVGIGATLAYFTDSEAVSNVITMGHVDVTLTENEVEIDETTGEYVQKDDVEAITKDGLEFVDVVPGQTVPKNPTITVADGSENCYVRATVEVVSEDIDAEILAVLEEDLQEAILANEDWTLTDGYYYFANEMTAGDTAVLFEEVTIPAQWNNAVADKSFNIKIKAEAVQAKNVEEVITVTEGKVVAWDLTADDILAYGE